MADHMAKRACEWLRFMGYDVEYPDVHYDNEILKICIENNLILLTRDIEFYKRYSLSIFLDSTDYKDQVSEIISLFPPDKKLFFTRCPVCNSILVDVSTDTLDPLKYTMVRQKFKTVKYCKKCNKYYWEGSHYKKILNEINKILKFKSI
ncbi:MULTISPECIES: Mut7-C RNAse domain-containing protein [Acidiplasma]|jgi:uncharacterized protein with PIN domain|nr:MULTISPECIES: Mut7-C RNAse domain-containing protein [Acidiplasma]WMT54638.1 MAG: Mut7-C RNAse domain-containing protein [Acidiplasma sp.]